MRSARPEKPILCVLVFGIAFLALTASCTDQRSAIRVGAKRFAEQAILAEMLARLLRSEAQVEASTEECGDTYSCYRALQQGRLDLLVGYSGTGLAFLGQARVARQYSLDSARTLYAPLGLTWLGPLGFDNSYRILVRPERGSAVEMKAISDLARLDNVRVACPPEYLRRPQDGLAALGQRYGLRLTGTPVVIQDPGLRMQALVDGRADAAVGYATDGAIADLGLRALDDDLEFFPPYEAAVVVRTKLLRQRPSLERVLRILEGRLNEETMRRLNYQVEVGGWVASSVARRFLQHQGLVKGDPDKSEHTAEVRLVVNRWDHLDPMVARATRAIRAVFSDRKVMLRALADPVVEIVEGKARLAVLGAERFFYQGSGGPPQRESRVEAVAVLGTRMVHLIRRDAGPKAPADPMSGRVGVGEAGSGRLLVAKELVALSSSAMPAAHDRPRRLLQLVLAGKLDAALILAEPGDSVLVTAFTQGGLKLCSLPQRSSGTGALGPKEALKLPYLRPARIPAGTYAGQDEQVETLAAQVLLAGLAPGGPPVGAGGPAAALPFNQPLTQEEIEALAKATKVAEAPDPVLPSAWGPSARKREPTEDRDTTRTVLDTGLNVLAIAFLVWLVVLVRREK